MKNTNGFLIHWFFFIDIDFDIIDKTFDKIMLDFLEKGVWCKNIQDY